MNKLDNLYPERILRLMMISYLISFLGFFWLTYYRNEAPITPIPWLNGITYLLDPIILNLLGGLPIFWVMWIFFRRHKNNSLLSSIIRGFSYAFVIGIAVMGFQYLADYSFIKPSFGYDRPDNRLGLTVIMEWLKIQNITFSGQGSSTPSGFTMRQIFITLTFLTISAKLNIWSTKKSQNYLFTWWTIFSLLLVFLTSFSRVYRGDHTIFDVGLSFGVGIILFWVVVTFITNYMDPIGKENKRLVKLATACACLPWFFYAGDANTVVVIFIVIFSLLGISDTSVSKNKNKIKQFIEKVVR